jgi:hypothetical protein
LFWLFFLQRQSIGKKIVTRSKSQGLYYLHTLSSTICDVSTPLDVIKNSWLWFLSAYQTYFPNSANKRSNSSSLGFVHFHIEGPNRMSSILGYQYYITFIDDFLRCTLITLLKDRSELFDTFQTYCSVIETQVGKKFEFCKVTMPNNIFPHHSTYFWLLMVSYICLIVQTLHNKIVSLSGNIVIKLI